MSDGNYEPARGGDVRLKSGFDANALRIIDEVARYGRPLAPGDLPLEAAEEFGVPGRVTYPTRHSNGIEER